MPRSRSIVSIAGLVLLLAGCATQDVVFVTKTAIGIDVDAQGASVAYDRTEGYVAPRYPNRQAAPVFASVATDGKLVGRNVKQVYATGNAATIVSGGTPLPPPPPATQPVIFRNAGLDTAAAAEPLPRAAPAAAPVTNVNAGAPQKSMFFGTGSVLGFKLSFGTGAAVDAFTFGFKRKEMSIIPHDESDQDLPSVMASLDTGVEVAPGAGTGNGSAFTARQFFATGGAAESLASDPQIQALFQSEAKTQLAQYRENERQLRNDALTSLGCLSELDDQQAKKVWQNVQDLSLFSQSAIDDLLKASTANARTIYTQNIARTAATSSTMTGLMKGHMVFVCRLVNRT